jgi:hypothetical protein
MHPFEATAVFFFTVLLGLGALWLVIRSAVRSAIRAERETPRQ